MPTHSVVLFNFQPAQVSKDEPVNSMFEVPFFLLFGRFIFGILSTFDNLPPVFVEDEKERRKRLVDIRWARVCLGTLHSLFSDDNRPY